MKSISSIFYQYRDLDFVYTFKQKNGQVVMKISDISGKCLPKKVLSQETWKDLGPAFPAEMGDAAKIPWLIEQGHIPPHFIPPKELVAAVPIDVFKAAIAEIEPEPMITKELQHIICPITQEVFVDPVDDENGHTFEKTWIEQHLKGSELCPVDRRPIHSLTPNRSLKQLIEGLKEKTKIPNFALFEVQKPDLAAQLIATGNMLAGEQQNEEALNSYIKAFAYTNDWKLYQNIPPFYEKMKQKRNGAIAYLYLAQYQWQSNEVALACTSLENALRLHPGQVMLLTLLAEAYGALGDSEKEKDLLLQAGRCFEKEKKDENAVQVYRKMIQRDHGCWEAYDRMIPLLSNEQKLHFYLIKALFHLRKGNRIAAEEACKTALLPSASFENQFPLLSILASSSNLEPLKNYCVQLAISYQASGNMRGVISCHKLLLSLEENNEYYEKIIAGYKSLKRPKQIASFSLKLLNRLISQKAWKDAERVGLQAKECSTDPLPIFNALEQIYSEWGENRLSQLWIDLGQHYEKEGKLELASETYRKALERFQEERHLTLLVEILNRQGRVQEAASLYFQGANRALQNDDLKEFCGYLERLRKIDPRLEHLEESQRSLFFLFQHIEGEKKKVEALSKQIEKLSQMSLAPHLSKERVFVRVRIQKLPPLVYNRPIPSNAAPPRTVESCLTHPIEGSILSLCPINRGFASLSDKRAIQFFDPRFNIRKLVLDWNCTALTHLSNALLLQGADRLQLWKVENDLALSPVKILATQSAFCELANGKVASVNLENRDRILILDKDFAVAKTIQVPYFIASLRRPLNDSSQFLITSRDGKIETCNLLKPPTPFPLEASEIDLIMAIQQTYVVSIMAIQQTYVVSSGKIIRILKSETNEILEFEAHEGKIKALSPLRRNLFATSSEDKTVKIWDAIGVPQQRIELDATCEILLLLSNGLLACGNSDGKILLLDPAKRFAIVQVFNEHSSPITALLEQNGLLISGSKDKIKLWSLG